MAGGRYKAKGTTDSEIAFCTIGFVWRGKVIMLINVCEKRRKSERPFLINPRISGIKVAHFLLWNEVEYETTTVFNG